MECIIQYIIADKLHCVCESQLQKMGNLFGRKKESRVTEEDKAVLVSCHS